MQPLYTEAAKKARIEGMVRLRVVVLPDGTVSEAHVEKSLDQKYGLDDEAVKAAKQWRFNPGTVNGQPVAVQISIEMTFTLK